MPFLTTRRIKDRIFPSPARLPTAGVRDLPQKVVLPARSGTTPSTKPPVRIYLGTEAGQYRAERLFIYSVDKFRDPSRVYEIHLMKDVRGYDRRWWLTGFTNYRFAIANWAGTGRAIYNDVDQIFLSDPAELFDADMGGKGFLAISPDDTAVMLIDCDKMKKIWTYEVVSHTPRKQIEKMSRDEWGKLEACWHARDFDYVDGYSKCLHYTTIHEQPWHPFPEVFVYMAGPVSHIWYDMEKEADEREYCAFDFLTEDTLYTEFVRRIRAVRGEDGRTAPLATPPPPAPLSGLGELLAQAGARNILEFTLADARNEAVESRVGKYPGATLTTFDPTATGAAGADVPIGPFDAVISTSGLELLSNEDIPWVLDQLMYRARKAAFVAVDDVPRVVRLSDGSSIAVQPRGFAWWRKQMEAASRNQPDVRWRLGVRRRTALGAEVVEWREGGKRLDDAPPKVWILADPKPGHTTQSIGLADTLGWPYEIKDVGFPAWSKVTDRLLGPLAFDASGRRASGLRGPWPDLVISTGWATGPVARWIAAQSEGKTSVIAMGRKGGDVATNFDLVATCSYVKYPPHERRIALSAPLCQVTPQRLADAAAKFPDLFAGKASPRIVVLVGGDCVQYELDDTTARRLGDDVAALAHKHGGSVVIVTSRRTPASAITLMEQSLRAGGQPVGEVHRWSADRKENPFLAYIAGADALVVTGESESMLAEACAAGKPVYIYPLRKKPPTLGQRFVDLVTSVAFSRPRKGKGTFRPQQGREYLCARLIERGIVHPTRSLEAYHQGLVAGGHARMFDGTLDLAPHAPLNEAEVVAERVRALLGISEDRRIPEEPRRATSG